MPFAQSHKKHQLVLKDVKINGLFLSPVSSFGPLGNDGSEE